MQSQGIQILYGLDLAVAKDRGGLVEGCSEFWAVVGWGCDGVAVVVNYGWQFLLQNGDYHWLTVWKSMRCQHC